MIVRIYTVRSPSDAEALGCGKQGYFYMVVLYSAEAKPVDIRRVCTVVVGYDPTVPDLDVYLDAVGVRFSRSAAFVFLKVEEVAV